MTGSLESFAAEVGTEGAVCVAGGRTSWAVGGLPEPGTREINAPSGVVAHLPAEMIVRVRAGTRLDVLQGTLAEGGQRAALEGPGEATVGGVVAVGRSGVRRLGLGPVRDAVLEVTAVSSRGELVRSGAPLVKNVTGYDLPRLLTGSLGTLALLAEVVLRCTPLPEVERWYLGEPEDPFRVFSDLYRPLSVLWDGRRTWVGLSGFEVDVAEQARTALGDGFVQVDGPPEPPAGGRRSLSPAALKSLAGTLGHAGGWLCEIGVGVVHCDAETDSVLPPADAPSSGVVDLHRRIKRNFDPAGRLNPGRCVLPDARVVA
ncbi:MAG TPA: FAD-binding protein [Acidimicrobiales bacterium]|nr:FAD-binding protein [Acidimicrobiales bacterium]